jgi:hypothetical protein
VPNRILRDWTDSVPVNALDPWAERTFTRLIMKADDQGRGRADVKLLRPLLYPLLLDHVRETDLERWMAECQKAGLVRLYEIGGKRYFEIVNFSQRMRYPSKHPPPPKSPETACERSKDGPQTVQGQSRDGPILKAQAQAEASSSNLDLGKGCAADVHSELLALGVTEPSLSRCLANQPALTPLGVLLLVEELRRQKPRNLPGLLVSKLTNGYRQPDRVAPKELLDVARGRLVRVAGKDVPLGAMLTQNDGGIYWNGGNEKVAAADLRPEAIVISRRTR